MINTDESFAVRAHGFLIATAKGAGIAVALCAALVAGGCESVTKPAVIGPVPAGSFVQQWSAPIPELKHDPVVALYSRGDAVYAYAKSHEVYGFSAAGGKLVFADQVISAASPLRAPTLCRTTRSSSPPPIRWRNMTV